MVAADQIRCLNSLVAVSLCLFPVYCFDFLHCFLCQKVSNKIKFSSLGAMSREDPQPTAKRFGTIEVKKINGVVTLNQEINAPSSRNKHIEETNKDIVDFDNRVYCCETNTPCNTKK